MRLDCEPRSLELRDRTYIHDDSLTDVCRSLLGTDWGRPDNGWRPAAPPRPCCTSCCTRACRARRRNPRAAAWPRVRRRVMDYVDAHLDAPHVG